METLRLIRTKLSSGGRILVEVPHARDALIAFYELESFKAFTFWSEHLILHTKESLRAFLEKAGFGEITITGCQRYPLSNHLYWLSRNKPGGHEVWAHLDSPGLSEAYAAMLARLEMTDTLVAVAAR